MGVISRFFTITFAALGFTAWLALVRTGLLRPRLSPAQKFTHTLERLGTTFVKLGQMLSIRQDLLSEEYVQALQSLQDNVAPFPFEQAISEIEDAFGRPIFERFSDFEVHPLAAASIAQVHRARYLPTGEWVVVKVRRPGIVRQMDFDMAILKGFLRLILPFASGLERFDPLRIADDIHLSMRQETDFRREARNIRRFGEVFADDPVIDVPQVVDGLVAENVLVQAMCVGGRISDFDDPEIGPFLADALLNAYLRQFFVLGFFHADPHPGNVFVTANKQVCLIDFGLVGFLDHRTRRNLAAYMQAFVCQDAEWLLDATLAMGGVAGEFDRDRFLYAIEEMLVDYASMPIGEFSYAEAFMRISRLGHGHNVRMPQNLLVLNRALYLLETILARLDPNLRLHEALKERMQDFLADGEDGYLPASARTRLLYESRFIARDAAESLARLLYQVRHDGLRVPLEHRGLTQFEGHIDRASNRLALAMMTLGLYVTSSLLIRAEAGPNVLGIPLLAGFGYIFALWLTIQLASGINRSGKL